MYIHIGVVTLLLLFISACGGGGGGSNPICNDKPLTVSYIQNKFAIDFPGFSESNTTIVHTDGNQGNNYDIDVLAVSRTTYNSDDSLALSFTIHGTTQPPTGTYFSFYIDADKNAATGMDIDGTLGADFLIINNAGGSANGYYFWDVDHWTILPKLGILASNASYHQGCNYSTNVYAPLYDGLSLLYTVPVTAVARLETISGSDPTIVTSILDSSSQFDFTVP